MQKISFLTPQGLVRQYNSPKPYCSTSIIIQGNFHLSKHPRERFDGFFYEYWEVAELAFTKLNHSSLKLNPAFNRSGLSTFA